MAKGVRFGLIIEGDAKGGVRAVKATDRQLERLNKTQGRARNRAREVANEMGKVAKSAARWGVAAGAAAAGGIALMVNRQRQLIDQQAKTSQMLGVSTENLAAMQLQAELTGVANEKLTMGLQRMTRRVSEAAQGSGEAQAAIKELGLDAQALNQLDPAGQFRAIGEAMEEVDNQSDRVRLGFKLFDSEGAALIRTLDGGSQAAKEAAEFTEQWGLALSRADAAQVERANDAMSKVARASEGFWKQLTVKVSPALEGVAQEVLGVGREYGGAEEAAERAYETMTKGAAHVLNALDGVGRVARTLANSLIIVAESSRMITPEDFNPKEFLASPAYSLGKSLWQQMFGDDEQQKRDASQSISIVKQALADIRDQAEKQLAGDKLLELFERQEKQAELTALKVTDLTKRSTEWGEAAAEGAGAATEATKELDDQLQSVLDKLYPQQKAVRELTDEWDLLAEAVAKNKAERSALDDWIDQNIMIESTTRDVSVALADAREQTGGLQEAGTDMAVAWERGLERVDDTMAGLFRDMVREGEISFDRLKDTALNVLGEILYAYSRNTVLETLGFSGVQGGGGGGLGNLLGGGSGGGGLDFGSLASAGGTLWNGVSGLASGEGLAGFTGLGGDLASAFGLGGQASLDSLLIDAGTRSTTIGGGITGGGGGGGFGSNLMSSAGSMWPLAVIAGMMQSGKLYDQGVRPDPDETWSGTGGNVIGQMGNVGPTLQSGVFESLDSILEPIVGGKGAAMLTGSTFHQDLWNNINKGIFGTDYQATRGGIKLGMGTHDDFNPTSWIRESKSGGLFSSSSRRYKFSELDDELREPLMETYESTLDRIQNLYDTVGVDVEESVLRAVETADMMIGTSGKSKQTEEEINKQISEWFGQLSDNLAGAVAEGMDTAQLSELAAQDARRAQLADLASRDSVADWQRNDERTAWSNWQDQGDTIVARAEVAETEAQLANLTQMIRQRYQTEQELIGQIMGYMDNAANNFAQTYESIFLDGLESEKERYQYFRKQADQIARTAHTLSDPAEINRAQEEYNQLINQAYGALGEGSADAMRDDILETLTANRERFTDLLQDRLDAISADGDPETPGSVANVVQGTVEGLRGEMRAMVQEMVNAQQQQNAQNAEQQQQVVNQFGQWVGQLPNSFNVTVETTEVG